jgi:predicted Zn-dependent peptidase
MKATKPMEVSRTTLSNGIRVVHLPAPSVVAHTGVFLNTGSRDEGPLENGLAHFIEHVLFKGTQKRRSYQVLSRLENVGGDLNAYTTKEDTCVYASFLPGHYDRALELFADILYDSVFPEKELQKEKEVILDEINGYLDTPFEQIFDDFEEQLFNGHPLGRNILGTPEQLKRFGRAEVLEFIRRNYRNEETVIASVGPLSPGRFFRLAESRFARRERSVGERPRDAVNGYEVSQRKVERVGFQTHCIIGNRAYPLDHPRHFALSLLNNILGGPGMNSRLNLSLREKYGLTYHVESSYHPYSDTGVFEIYLGTDNASLNRAMSLAFREMDKLRKEGLGSLQLTRARQQLKGQIAIAGESNLNLMLALGKGVMSRDRVETLEDIYRRIDAVTREELLEVANDILEPGSLSMLTYTNTGE